MYDKKITNIKSFLGQTPTHKSMQWNKGAKGAIATTLLVLLHTATLHPVDKVVQQHT